MELGEVRALAEGLLREHGLVGEWSFDFDHARRRAGQCDFYRHRVTLSAPLMRLYQSEQVREVILHEIAHALAGARHHHDRVWRETAERIGAKPQTRLSNTPEVSPLWVGRCAAGHEFGRYRRPVAPASCMICARRAAEAKGSRPLRTYNRNFRIIWTNTKTGETL